MDDETVKQAENQEVAEESNVDTSPVVEEQTSEESQETEVQETDSQGSQNQKESEAQAEETNESSQDTSERKPTRAERRIRQLRQELEQERQSNQQPSQFQQPQYPQVDPGAELTPEQYQQHVVQAADTIASARVREQMEQYQAQSNLDKDIDTLPQLYPELDEESDSFDPVIYDRVVERFKREAYQNGRLNPQARLADVAKDYVEVARAAAERSNASIKKNIEKTVDESAVKPNATSRPEKSPSDMSIDEMEKKFGIVYQ